MTSEVNDYLSKISGELFKNRTVSFLIPYGIGRNMIVNIFLEGFDQMPVVHQNNSLRLKFNYDKPIITSITPSPIPSTIGTVTFTGLNLGQSISNIRIQFERSNGAIES